MSRMKRCYWIRFFLLRFLRFGIISLRVKDYVLCSWQKRKRIQVSPNITLPEPLPERRSLGCRVYVLDWVFMVDKWKLFEGDLQDLRTCTGTKLPMNKNSEFETVLAQFLVDLNTPSTIGVTDGVKPRVATELPKISILETRAA